ncbi:MAG: YraN family protein [Aquificaceae bacterium]|nr:YraN family protein [Aquificaceae bacterium]MCX7989603.1 YraN family protein [Aquificaceae bacterium]MDW8033237.1 YraN family protein [Aquificaceae bacterium]
MRKGVGFEGIAVRYLQSLGYRILHRNYHCRCGEIDIVALDGEALVFVEVKGGKSKVFGDPAERVNREKLRRIIACAEEFLQKHPAESYRLEVVVIRGEEVEHIREVF